MAKYKCIIKYQPVSGGTRTVTEQFEAKNCVDAKARASGMYANTTSVHVTISA